MAENVVKVENLLNPLPVTGSVTATVGQPLAVYDTKPPALTAAYAFSQEDLAGVAGAYNYNTLYNPVGSGKLIYPISATVSQYIITGSVNTQASLHLRRFTGAPTGGSVVAAGSIFKYDSTYSNPSAEVRTTNPTVTLAQSIVSVPPAVNTNGAATILEHISASPSAGPLILREGEGVAWMSNTGNANLLINIAFTWSEG